MLNTECVSRIRRHARVRVHDRHSHLDPGWSLGQGLTVTLKCGIICYPPVLPPQQEHLVPIVKLWHFISDIRIPTRLRSLITHYRHRVPYNACTSSERLLAGVWPLLAARLHDLRIITGVPSPPSPRVTHIIQPPLGVRPARTLRTSPVILRIIF